MLYVLKLQHGKFYVGKSNFIQVRIKSHMNGGGCEWTKKHKPVCVLFYTHGCTEEEEDILTLQMMYKYGWTRVRGGKWSSVHIDKSPLEIHNKCDVKSLEECLRCGEKGHTIETCYSDIKCYKCKEYGHISKRCPNKIKCFTCKGYGHLSRNCKRICDRICFYCGESGHYKKDCSKTTLYKEVCFICNSDSHKYEKCPGIKCYKCGEKGHIASYCNILLN